MKIVVGFVLFSLFFFGDNKLIASSSDSTKILTFDDFLELVLRNHPVAQQSELLDDKAKQELRVSRNGFDPYVYSKYNKKQFEGKNYYSLWETYLTIPTWFGTSFKTGYEEDFGINLNLDNLVPSQGLSYIGLSSSLLQGLVIDERRAILRQAQFFPKLAEAEKVKLLNKLLLNAAKEYWEWWFHYKKLQQYVVGYNFADIRFKATLERAKQGDLSMIDTVEAIMQMQNIEVLRNQSELDYKNSSLMLSNFLWNTDKTPLEINQLIIPDSTEIGIQSISKQSLDSLVSFAIINHPEIVKLETKIKQLEIERRLVINKILPKLNVDYGLQQRGFYNQPNVEPINYNFNNFKIAATFSTPIFLRAERGKLQLTKLKLQDSRFEFKQTNREVINSVYSSYNEYTTLEKLIIIQQKLVQNSDKLRIAEQTRFDNGESSLFLVNTRDMALINSRIKLFELETKYQKSKNTISWSAGKMLR
ncbi:MAG: hypothetical protein EAZ07_09445 [Cytophagales bacterium]|nr:MAG: hypothetical protein EAZ07_09445 [Cytophagales bacterium]